MDKFKWVVLLSMCLLMSGCIFARTGSLTVGAKGAKAPQGTLEAGELIKSSSYYLNLFCKKQ